MLSLRDDSEKAPTAFDLDALERGNFSAPPTMVSRLLRAIAAGRDAGRYRYDTILIGAAAMIEAFEHAR
jgi:hypothetical protein